MAITINKPPDSAPANVAISERLKVVQREKDIEAKAAAEAAKLPISNSADHHLLIVDGKAKKVSKRSQYLIDMMTVDE